MDKKLQSLVDLKKITYEMERELGLSDLPEPQKLSFLAAIDLQRQNGGISTSDLRNHFLLEDMPRPTFFRAINALEAAGKLFRPVNAVRGYFSLQEPND